MSRIDVIIPCYNYGHYLEQCVRSVLSQEGVDVRVLILDDASPDNTPEVAQRLAAADRRIEYRRHQTNQRHIATYNEGLAWATGDYLLLLSADDLLVPGALRRAADVMDTHPEVALTWGEQIQFDEDVPRVPAVNDQGRGVELLPGDKFIEWCCTLAHNPVATPTAVARTAVQHRVGGYSRDLPHTADMEMWFRLAMHGSVCRLGAVQALKRAHRSNMQLQYVTNPLGDLPQRRETFDRFFSGPGRELSDRDRLQDVARRALGMGAFWAASRAFDRGQSSQCQEILDVALELDPELVRRPEWSRLRWKRRLGARAWKLLRPLSDWLRQRRAARLYELFPYA